VRINIDTNGNCFIQTLWKNQHFLQEYLHQKTKKMMLRLYGHRTNLGPRCARLFICEGALRWVYEAKETMNEGAEANGPDLTPTKPSSTEADEPLPAGGVGVALLPNGRTLRVQGNHAEDFIPFIESSSLAWVDMPVVDFGAATQELVVKLGFSDSLLPSLLKGAFSNYEDRDTELGIRIPALEIRRLEVKDYDLLVLMNGKLILSLHSVSVVRFSQLSRYAEVYLRKLPSKMPLADKLTNMLVRILDQNNDHNAEQLRELEAMADELSNRLTDPTTPQATLRELIYGVKHALVSYLNVLWRCVDVLNSLRYGDADVLTDNTKVLVKIAILNDDVNRQINNAEHTAQVLSSGLEVVQTLYNNQLQTINNRMTLVTAWLTILGTAILVPNTIATFFSSIAGVRVSTLFWYSNAITLATVGGTLLAYWWVRTRVVMPRGAADTSALAIEPVHRVHKGSPPK
jgi:magnesium transporter